SCAMHGVLPVDAAGEPLGPLITWMDRRSAAIADRWKADGTGAELYGITGAPMHPMLPACKLRWLAENDPALFARATKFVSLKELLVFRWTGEWLIDWGMASGTGLFDFRTRTWSERALQLAGVEAARLSEPASTLTKRPLRVNVANALGFNDPPEIVLASSDGALANLGVGAVDPREPALTLGTSGAIRVVLDSPALDGSGRTFCYCFDDTRYVVGGPTSSAGAVLNKLHDLFLSEVPPAERFTQSVAFAADAQPGANGVTILPFLGGERAPYWLADLRGAIIGLDLSHTRADILRAAFESVVLALRTVFDVVAERIDTPKRIRLSGGLTHAPLVRQLVADIFNCEAVLSDKEEASAFGAALMAAIAVGALRDARDSDSLSAPVYVHTPNPEMVARYAVIVARYRDCVEANLPLFTHDKRN
ncbi:MAG TPA: gluconokinase, partial [Candidatus Baltobacteraceae bacterium]